MKQVSISSLGDLKTVFNSPDDNVHYFNVISKVFNSNSSNVILAKPIVRNNLHQIIWKADVPAGLISLNEIPNTDKELIGSKIKNAFDAFGEKGKSFRNFPPDFVNKIQEIPDLGSIKIGGLNSAEEVIVITNWAFLEDNIDRKSGLLQSIFPAPNYSILAKVEYTDGSSAPGYQITLNSAVNKISDISDKHGYVRLGNVKRGDSFELIDQNGSLLERDLIADGRDHYVIRVQKELALKIRLLCSEDRSAASYEKVTVQTGLLAGKEFTSDENGEIFLNHPYENERFIVSHNGEEKLSVDFPSSDETFEVLINCPAEEPLVYEEMPEIEDEEVISPPSTVIKFSNFFGRPIKNFDFTVEDNQGEKTCQGVTDEFGEHEVMLEKGPKVVRFKRFGVPWSYDFNHTASTSIHHFKPRGIFPWFWWIVCALLLLLLLCCWLRWDYCQICNDKVDQVQTTDEHHEEAILEEDDLNSEESEEVDDLRESYGGTKGDVTISLTWRTLDDLDLHVVEPNGNKIYFVNKISDNGGKLDIDMNAEQGASSSSPIENIYYGNQPIAGTYKIYVNLYGRKETRPSSEIPYKVYVSVGEKEFMLKGALVRENTPQHIYNLNL